MEEKKSLLDNEQLIEEDEVTLPVTEDEKIEVTDEAKEAELELERISASTEDKKNLKTTSIGKKWAFVALFITINVAAVLATALLEFTGETAPMPLSYVWGVFISNYPWLIGLGLMFVLSILFNAMKRYTLLKGTLNKKMPLISLNATILCKYYDAITPLGSGGQPFEIYYLRKKGVPIGIASGVPVASYCMDRIAFVLVSIVALVWQGFSSVPTTIIVLCWIGIVINAAIPTAILFFTIMPKVAHAVSRFVARVGKKLHIVKDEEECYKKISGSVLEYAECLKYFIHRSKARFFYGVVLSILSLVALYSMPYFVVRMCGIAEGSWIKILSLTVICYMSVTLLPTPGNSGGAEFSFRSIFASFLSGGILFWGMLAWRIASYYLFVISGFILIIVQQCYKFTKRGKLAQQTIDDTLKKEKMRREEERLISSGQMEPPKPEFITPPPQEPQKPHEQTQENAGGEENTTEQTTDNASANDQPQESFETKTDEAAMANGLSDNTTEITVEISDEPAEKLNSENSENSTTENKEDIAEQATENETLAFSEKAESAEEQAVQAEKAELSSQQSEQSEEQAKEKAETAEKIHPSHAEALAKEAPIIPDNAAQIVTKATIEPEHSAEDGEKLSAAGANTIAEFTAVINESSVEIKHSSATDEDEGESEYFGEEENGEV